MTSGDIPPVLPRCPHCGAHLQPQMVRCWLCFAAIPSTPPAQVPVELARPPEFSQLGERIFQGLSILVAGLVLLILLGTFLQEPAAGVTLTMLLFVPLSATVLRLYLQKQRYGRVSWAERLATFLVSTALLVMVLGVLVVAAFIAFFVWCLMSGPVNFH
ncbi:MAG: hypothetical protein U0935_12485 [Pirellulales bacterium]